MIVLNLKKSIVIVNEYTVKKNGKASRGATPGNYVNRYMARDKAVETLTPVKLNSVDNFITRYMARSDAVDNAINLNELRGFTKRTQAKAGIAFGDNDISLSNDKLLDLSRQIQENFDKNKTVLKTVLSFDTEFLRERGIISPDFEPKKDGDFRGNIDQMKLRLGIMHGIDKIKRHYDDLHYVGVIQVDTMHVHCHLAMCDFGEGKIMSDGRQKGKIDEIIKTDLRRGVDQFLDDSKHIKYLASNVTYDRRNARMFIKKYTHNMIKDHGLPQFLLATLPENKNLWRAKTNRKEMRKPNMIVREYVMQIFEKDDSGYTEAMRDIVKYAEERQKREGLSTKDYRKLVQGGEDRLIENCMNGVYSVLKNVPDEKLKIKTPMLDIMSKDYEELANQVKSSGDDFLEFGFRLRSYSSRINHHKKEKKKYRNLRKDYEKVKEKSVESQALNNFYKFEEDYNEKCMTKYQYFLDFIPPRDEYYDEFEELLLYKQKMFDMEQMILDESMKKMSTKDAESYGLNVYKQHGGSYKVLNPSVLDDRYDKMKETYGVMEENLKSILADNGLSLDDKGISKKKKFEFDDVKALDIHHLEYDFHRDIDISKLNIDRFVECTRERYDSFMGAVKYLEGTGQSDYIYELPYKDIEKMVLYAQKISKTGILENKDGDVSPVKRLNTVTLDNDYNKTIESKVKEMISITDRSFGD